MKKNKRGFTLIELLAVIVILAIIALIATPIVLNIIDESKKSAQLVSAQNYLRAAENAIALSTLNNKSVEDGVYAISSEGQICLYALKDEKCLGNKEDMVDLEISGEKPEKGYVTISSGQILDIDLYYGDQNLRKTGDDDFIYPEYTVGEEIKFNPGPVELAWNVVSETKDSVTLLLNGNLPTSLSSNTLVSITYDQLFDTLSSMDTSSFTNVDYIKDFSYSNSQGIYKNIEIKDGEITITDSANNKKTLAGKTKMRVLTFEEVYKIILMHDPRAAYELSDAKLDDNLEFVIDAQLSMTLAEAEALGIKSWSDAREYMLTQDSSIGISSISKRDAQITNIHMLLYSEAGVLDDVNVNFPSWLAYGLTGSGASEHYALLTTLGSVMYTTIDNSPAVVMNDISREITGIRPVIEVSKDKLK